MSLPTTGETFAKLIENLKYAQEHAAILAHLHADDGGSKGRTVSTGWLAVSEGLKLMQHQVTMLATKGRLN